MKNLFLWLWDGDNVGPRLAAMLVAGSAYVTGAGWDPRNPQWVAGAVGVLSAAAISRPNGKVE